MADFDHWLPESLQYSISPPDLDGLSREEVKALGDSGDRGAKNAAILSLQQAVDGRIEREVDQKEYERIKEEASEAVITYYNGNQVEAVEPPQNSFSTRQSGFLTHESPVRHFPDKLEEFSGIDTVVPVASGGLEPGIVAAAYLDSDMKILRYSTNDHSDTEPIDIEGNYRGEDILVVDDTSYSGETLNTVEEYLRYQGARSVDSEAVSVGRIGGTVTLVESYLKDFYKAVR